MKERVGDLVGNRARAMWVSTFHSMCVRILRAEAAQLGMKSTFTIYDAADSQRLAQLVANGLNIDTKKYPARSLAAQISNLKNELIDPETAADRADSDQTKIVARVYDGYQSRLKAAQAFDFDDLIMQTVELLAGLPGRRRALPAAFPACAGRRIPGHQPRAVHAGQGAGRRDA